MTDLEANHHAERILSIIMEVSPSPLDGIAILGLTVLKCYDAGCKASGSINSFAEDFRKSLIESYNQKSDIGPKRMQ